MRVLIIGASGPTGKQLVAQSLAHGHSVVALVRHDIPRLEGTDGVTLVEGDVLDCTSVLRAMSGCNAVLCALGSKLSLVGEVTLLSEGTRNLVNAMHLANVKRLIAITGIGAGDSRGHGGFIYDALVEPVLLREVYKDKDRQEDIIRASGLDWTIVRPAQLTDDPPENHFQVLTDLGDITATKISRADVAAFMVSELAAAKYVHKTPLLTD